MLRSELGLSFNDVMYKISLTNLVMLSKCTPNFNYKNKEINNKKGSISLESFFNTLPVTK